MSEVNICPLSFSLYIGLVDSCGLSQWELLCVSSAQPGPKHRPGKLWMIDERVEKVFFTAWSCLNQGSLIYCSLQDKLLCCAVLHQYQALQLPSAIVHFPQEVFKGKKSNFLG